MTPDIVEAVATAVTVFIGSLVLGTVGFGMGISTTPFLLLVLEPKTIVVVVNSVSIILFVLVIAKNRSHLQVREIAPISAAGVAGVPVAVYALDEVGTGALRIGIALLILALTALTASNVRGRLPPGGVLGLVVGFVGSVLINTTGIGGPLIVLYGLSRGWSRNAVRASASLYFLAIEGAGVAGYFFVGLMTKERATLVLIAAPPLVIGFWLATNLVGRMNEAVFRRAVLSVITVACVVVLVRELAPI
jgi:uncharacterized membrane protein YfcA